MSSTDLVFPFQTSGIGEQSEQTSAQSTQCLPSLRILHVISSFDPVFGGPPEALRQLAKAYASLRIQIEAVCLDDPRESFLSDVACPVHALGQRFLGRYALSPRLLRWLSANANRFDAFVMHGIWTFPGIAVRLSALRAGKPYGNFIHGALDPWFDRQYPLKHIKKQLYWPIQYAVLRDASAVFFTAESERDLARTSYQPSHWKSEIVSYGIDDPGVLESDCERQIDAFYRRIPQLRGRRYLLFLSRIHTKKGCDLLIKAFAAVASSQQDVDLVIAGPDQEGMQAKLQRLSVSLGIAHRVHWPGMIHGDSKWGALRACEALVLSSHSENFGIAIVECLAVGRPVLISNQVNIWREIEQDRAGLVSADTLEGTENLLRQWFRLSAREREEMAGRARPSFLARFTIARTAISIYHVIAEVIAQRKIAAIST